MIKKQTSDAKSLKLLDRLDSNPIPPIQKDDGNLFIPGCDI